MTFSVRFRADVKPAMRGTARLRAASIRSHTLAINLAARKIRTASVKELAVEKKIAQKFVSRRIKVFRASSSNIQRKATARIFLGYQRLKVANIGKITQHREGTRIGRKLRFPGSFVATMKSGHTGSYKRRGKSRLPIEEDAISFEPQGSRIIKSNIASIGPREFKREYNRLMSLALGKARLR